MRGKQIEFMTTEYPGLYEKVVPADHPLRTVAEQVDFLFVYRELNERYPAQIGRPPYDPVFLFKYLFLKAQYDLTDEEVVERSRYDLSFKCFLGLSPEADVINPSTLSRFRTQRFQDEQQLERMLATVRKAWPAE